MDERSEERPSLLSVVQRLLERTYRMRSGIADPGRFVIGDRGLRLFFSVPGDASIRQVVNSAPGSVRGQGARTLVRQTAEGIRACVYYPDDLIECLERFPPQRGVGEENVDAFATLVEELDHLLVLADRSRQHRPLTLFEMELHANVSKHLVLTRFLAGRSPGRHRIGRRHREDLGRRHRGPGGRSGGSLGGHLHRRRVQVKL